MAEPGKPRIASVSESSTSQTSQLSATTRPKSKPITDVPIRDTNSINGSKQANGLTVGDNKRRTVADLVNVYHNIEEEAGNLDTMEEQGFVELDGSYCSKDNDKSKCVIL